MRTLTSFLNTVDKYRILNLSVVVNTSEIITCQLEPSVLLNRFTCVYICWRSQTGGNICTLPTSIAGYPAYVLLFQRNFFHLGG